MDQHVREIVRRAQIGDPEAWDSIIAALQRSIIEVPRTHFYLLEIGLDDGNALSYYCRTKQGALKILVTLAAQELRDNGDGDLIEPADSKATVLVWKDIFARDVRIT